MAEETSREIRKLEGKVVSNKTPDAAKEKKGALPEKHTVGQGSNISEASPKGGQPNRVEARGFPFGKKGAKGKKDGKKGGKPKKGVNPFANKVPGVSADIAGNFGTQHNSAPFMNQGSMSKGPTPLINTRITRTPKRS